MQYKTQTFGTNRAQFLPAGSCCVLESGEGKGLSWPGRESDRTGFTTALRRACKAAGVDYRTPHEAGRHGYYTELRVRQGLAAHEVAEAGRWAKVDLPERTYAHSDAEERRLRAQIRSTDLSKKA